MKQSLDRIRALLRKELRQIFRDPKTKRIVFASPILQLLLFGYAFSWVGAVLGLTAPSAEAAQSAGTVWLFPFAFVSSAFVPTESMPGWLQARWRERQSEPEAPRERRRQEPAHGLQASPPIGSRYRCRTRP